MADPGRAIEEQSMAAIEREVGPHPYGPDEWPVVRRVIHATADFDFAGACAVSFGPGAARAGAAALRRGAPVVADVHGVAGLLSSASLGALGCPVSCRISEPAVARAAAAAGTTRAAASMRASAAELDGGVAVVGNAPTALREVVRMAAEGAASPALVVGLPVGFVGAAESKAELAASGLPHVTNRGRKGGSPAAAAALNALALAARSPPGGGGAGADQPAGQARVEP